MAIPLSLAMVTGMAHAQSSVTLYGLAGGGLRWLNNTKGGSTLQYASVEAPNRFGLRGSEDLGNGVNAIFALENSFATANGTMTKSGVLFDQAAYVGLTGAYGKLTFGRQLTAGEDLGIELDPDHVAGANVAITPSALLGTNFFTLDTRFNNTVKYRGKFGGAAFAASYSLGGVAGNTQAGASYSAMATYQAGPLLAGAGYQRTYNADATQVAQSYQAGGFWQMGPVRLYMSYFALTVSGSSSNPAQRRDSIPQGGIVYQVTPALVLTAAVYDDIASNLGNKRGANGHKTTAYAIADYFLSKSTDVYIEFDRNSFTGAYRTDPTNLALFNRNPASTAATGVSVGFTTRF
ncbi:porin [Paraburkholderia fungorum]|uniref:Porin n=1 Tax=Paraburkholderia fungorum TaxID=134537 RepID=A0A420FKB5_9BURK|nr:porin [Paraburkholderia fungorum]RKF33356.1 porin [Paraburkholderia fungorum]